MTNHTDSSRSTDSDSSAPNSPELTRLSIEQAEERTEREGRAKEWIAANYDKWFSARKAACKTMYGTEPVIELLAEYTQTECSRLASRVEELEKLLAEWVEMQDECDAYPTSDGHPVYSSRKLLAGAHAEEK